MKKPANFIRNWIDSDLQSGKHSKVITRFPPEPNGYLHIGHAKSICLNFGIAEDYQGECYLRFDDTNPINEDEEYSRAIEEDVRWLGYDWKTNLFHTSDYFETLYEKAVHLIQIGKAYVDSSSAETMQALRGTLKTAGQESPDRNRSVEENLALFKRMRAGEFNEGQYILRAKIDMTAGNINLRDPAIYRIRKVTHQRTGEKWCIYPMYDFSHALSDAIEGITHSLCTLEFQDHRPLYNWFVENCEMPNKPQQIEFARLNFNYTITSKRKLKFLVEEKHVSGWDDPRMPTLRGMRRRGIPPEAIRQFCDKSGISKQDSVIDISVLEAEIRDYLNIHAQRRIAVLKPLKVILLNYPENQTENLLAHNHPQNKAYGQRTLTFSREVYIDADDFMENPTKDFNRLSPGGEVRLLHAYAIRCEKVIKNNQGEIIELHCTYAAETLGGKPPNDGRKIKGTVHWLDAQKALDANIRLYDRLFSIANPGAEEDFIKDLNPNSLIEYKAKIEPKLVNASPEERFQFLRVGYFVADRFEHNHKNPVFNQIVSLRETWNK